MPTDSTFSKANAKAVCAVALGLALSGCTLDNVKVPELTGPAELALSIRLTAAPDILTADGLSTSVIQATVRNENGQPLGDRLIFFAVADESGRFADIGTLADSEGVERSAGTGVIVRTAGNGVAQALYRTPYRTDATANQSVTVRARPLGDDFNGQVYRYVRIELRSAEPRLFPQNPNNKAPSCNFIIEAPDGFKTNVAILFQTTSSDSDGTIVRYEWDFADGTNVNYAPDTAHVFRQPGTYTVTHRVTDDDGGQAACATAPGLLIQ